MNTSLFVENGVWSLLVTKLEIIDSPSPEEQYFHFDFKENRAIWNAIVV